MMAEVFMAANPNSAPRPDPDVELVQVFEAEQEAEALVVKGLLESAGIDCDLRAIDFPQDVLPMGGVILLVRAEDVQRAREIIEQYRRTPAEQAMEEGDLEDPAASDFTEEQESER